MKGNTAEGLPDLNSVLERDPNNQAALVGRGLAMMISGQLDRALVAFNQSIGKTSDDSMARLLRARTYLAKGDANGAMPDLNFILAVHPDDSSALTVRGSAWSVLRDYPKALKDLGAAIDKQETIENHLARAKVYEAQNDNPRATADYRRATELTPRNVFDSLAQANAKQKIQQLSKKIPCGSTGSGTCL
jgi:tetratricopeptide (TPR) repeat protein